MMTEPNNKEEFPSIPEQASNLAKFTVSVVKQAVINVTDEDILVPSSKIKERMDICKECQYYSSKQNRCQQCGCWLVHKVKFSQSKCPINKW